MRFFLALAMPINGSDGLLKWYQMGRVFVKRLSIIGKGAKKRPIQAAPGAWLLHFTTITFRKVGWSKDMTISKGTSIFVPSGERAALSRSICSRNSRNCTNGSFMLTMLYLSGSLSCSGTIARFHRSR